LVRTEQVLVVDPEPSRLAQPIAYVDETGMVGQLLKDRLHADAAPLTAGADVSRILLDGDFSVAKSWRSYRQRGPSTTTPPPADPSLDPHLFDTQLEGPVGGLCKLPVANGKAQVELFFGSATRRTFDVALNGVTVLTGFSPAGETGGGGVARHFEIEVANGTLMLSVPAVKEGSAIFAAIRVTDAKGAVTRRVFRAEAFTDRQGDLWQPVQLIDYDFAAALQAALPHVREGARAVLVTGSDLRADAAGKALAAAGVIDFNGVITRSGPSWFGSWYFGRKHWLLEGLPADGVWDWQYQADAGEADGMLLSGHDIEGVVGFSRSHSPQIGLGVATIPVGKGQIVVLCLPGLTNSIADPGGAYHGFQPVSARRLLYNALK
jgi:hypothetical protein